LGTAVFGGYLIATFIGLFLVPVLYIIVKQLVARFFGGDKPGPDEDYQSPLPEPIATEK
jgi:HAE1 family hydrophobic/amphiphilic exporter-1